MKLYNIIADGEIHLAVEGKKGIVDATKAGCTLCMDEVIAGAGLGALKEIADCEALEPVENPVWANIVNTPGKLVCVGLNYRSHAEAQGVKALDKVNGNPILFSKFSDCLVPAGSEVETYDWEESYDYEAELVIVIGKKCWNVSPEEANDYVFGYTCGNDFSCRVPQKRTSQWLIGKAMPGFGPCGPCIVTRDEVCPEDGLAIRSYVNGELRQDGKTNQMIFSPSDIISYASKYIMLKPGDLIFTGTPSGVQLEKAPGEASWLKKGDEIRVEIEGIGALINRMK